MKKTTLCRTAGLALGLVLVSSARAAEPGWYFVGFGGESSASGLDVSGSEDRLDDLFDSVDVDVVDVTSTVDDSDTGFGLAGGYQLNDHFAFEIAYVDLGSVGSRHVATVTDGVQQETAEVDFQTSADGAAVSVLGILPIGERFSVYGRLGLSFLSATGTASITVDGVTQRPRQSDQKTDPVYGVGVEYAIGKYSAVRLSWDRYTDIGTENVSGDIDGDLIALGFRLGVGWFQ
ncbi:MAG TPA: outer membrane beta-barrel protein [Steroidobacteraceae bacterium]|mgnify:CR=1 FL=1|nr:outer membrane beta-barrel protein [Steroidobacteraceae bacterium]